MRHRSLALSLLAAAAGGVSLTGCSTAPTSETGRETLSIESRATLERFRATDPSLGPVLDRAEGWAVFPSIGRGGFIAGGAFGRGEVFERGGQMIGFCNVTQGTVGLQAGGQSFSQIIVFLTPQAFADFKNNAFVLSANISAVALSAGAAGAGDYTGGVLVLVEPQGGLMAELSIGGQRFTFEPR